MMCSAYRLNKQWQQTVPSYFFLNPEPISCSIQGSNSCFLIYIQVSQKTGKMVWYSHLCKSSPQFVMIHTVKGFIIVGETEVDVFLELPSFLCDPVNVGNLISGSSAFSKPCLDVWKSLVCIMLKPSMQSFKHDFTSMEDECNCLINR